MLCFESADVFFQSGSLTVADLSARSRLPHIIYALVHDKNRKINRKE